jgi:hypothetical protein
MLGLLSPLSHSVPSVSHRTDSSQLFINGLREADTPIIDRSRLEIFLDDAFHNYRSLLDVHSFLLENLQTRQIEQHPNVGMISDLVLDAALNWQDAYMEYVTHYPIAKAKVQEEQQRNPRFALFLEVRSGIPRFDSLCPSPHSLLSCSWGSCTGFIVYRIPHSNLFRHVRRTPLRSVRISTIS